MSDKHLTELPWKMMAAKSGLKDTVLQKALASYSKLDPAKVPKAAMDALGDISELALKIKKANAAKEELVDYLDEIIKEIKKVTPSLQARAGATTTTPVAEKKVAPTPDTAEDEEQEKEAAEFKKDLKKKLIEALAQVKMRAPGPPQPGEEPKPQLQFMAFLAGESCSLIIARKVGSGTKKILPEIAGAGTSGKFVTGECIFEKNTHTFVVDQVPAGLRKKIEKALQTETGTKYKARVRSSDGSSVEDAEEEPAAEQVTPTPTPPSTPPGNADDVQFKQRFAALLPEIKAKPQLKSGDKTLLVLANEAGALAGKREFDKALQLLDLIETTLKQPRPPTGQPKPQTQPTEKTPPRQIKLSTYLNGRSNLRAARENSEKELRRLQQAILAKAADEPFFKEIETKSQRLFDFLTPLDDSVANKLEEAGRCTDDELQHQLNQKVRELIQKQLSAVRAHPLATFVESNPFGKFAIKQPVEVTLAALDQQLS